MKFFLFAFIAAGASKLKVNVGVDWSLCDLEKFHQFEYLAELSSPSKAIETVITNNKSINDKLFDALKKANYYAPKAKLYASLQPKLIPCETFVSNGQDSSCNLADIKPASSLHDVYDFDHKFGQEEPKYFLYSTLSSPKLAEMLESLKDESFIFRPLTLLHGCKDLTEWIDLDGTSVVEFEAKSPAKKTKFKPVLPAFLDHFKPRDFAIDYTMELSSIAEIALKMSQVIMDSKEPAKALQFISSNYPTLQKGLNAVKLRKDFVQAVEKQHQTFGPGLNHIRVNGFDLNGDVLDYYRLLGFLLAVQKFTKATSIGRVELAVLVQKQLQAANNVVYDLDFSDIVFFNDLERDAQYTKWPASFSVLTMNQQMNSPFKYIRRNMFTLVVFIPMSHPQLVEIINDLHQTVQQQVPLRIGFQLTAPNATDEVALKVFRKLLKTTNIQQAFKFLVAMKHEQNSCDDALKKADLQVDCVSYAQDQALPKYAKRFTKLTSWSNGKMATGDSMTELLSGLGFRYQNELLSFIKAWTSRELTDSTDLKGFIFDEKRYTVLKEYIPEIAEEGAVYVQGKDGLYCPATSDLCSNVSGDAYYYYNGRQILKREDVSEKELIENLVAYENAVASESALVNKELQEMLKKTRTELNPILQAPGLVVNREWTHNPMLSFNIGKSDAAPLHLEAFLNPNSKAFPKLVLLLTKFADSGFISGVVSLNPTLKVIDYMYRDFYSLGEQPELLPEDLGFAVKLDGPASWIATVKESSVDPDNVTLQDQRKNLKITFEVKHLVIEGQYLDKDRTGPAQGVQLELKEKNDLMTKRTEKTLVMANYGYFQFKCQPAVYELASPLEQQKRILSVHSFSVPSKLLKAELPKDWYKQVLDMLAKEEEDEAADTLNIFSIASGESYERMLRIMMTSVVGRKKGGNKLKFWLFDSFVSPQFRASIQKLSTTLGFEYEFISYKWPTWLLTQKTKLRTVWAYKILFLDVIFPRHVGRVIFVDADQVARADLTELAVLDMEDQVYGFVPFCDDRSDMASFRFWEAPGSYWEQQLQGKPYHISALFVVDLKRFRATLTGDMLRQQYQMLAQDPHSLANLDQDLPNSLQGRIPIYSLPQEWLWCETWCSAGTKSRAKIIDLCNNPKTREEKLKSAPRIIGEWRELDERVKKILLEAKEEL